MTHFQNFNPDSGDHMQRHDPADPQAHPTEAKTSGMAIAAMILGISAWISCGLTAIPGLILGIIAMNQVKDPSREIKGGGMALTGVILSALALLLPVLALLIAILLPALGAARNTARQMTNNVQGRGIHQAVVTYAQSNKSWYPGLDTRGQNPQDVSQRFQILLDGYYFTPEYIINPLDSATTPVQASASGTYSVQPNNYSYAMLSIMPDNSDRREEWKDSLNSQAVVLSDRNTNPGGHPESVMSGPGGIWRGMVVWNDGHVITESSSVMIDTQYGRGPMNSQDELFQAPTTHDAMMIHQGR